MRISLEFTAGAKANQPCLCKAETEPAGRALPDLRQVDRWDSYGVGV